jgi:glycosyltransferase involved in cell wall biosynthesis
MSNVQNNIKVVYVHGRPSGHPIHDEYARLLHSDFCFTDHKIRWHDVKNVSKFRRLLSWIVCAFTFPNRKKYTVFFTEGVRESVLFLKLFRLITRNQKVIALVASESLYFLDNKKYNFLSAFIVKKFFEKCDGVICIGEPQKKLALKYCKTKSVYSIYNGLSEKNVSELSSITPMLDSNTILVIANADSDWRIFYKGVDLAISTFLIIAATNKEIELLILGSYDTNLIFPLLKNVTKDIKDRIFFKGNVNILEYLKKACLTLQLGRGDSFPTSTLESAFAGVPVFISTDTGTKEMLNSDLNQFCVSLNPNEIAEQVETYLSIPYDSKVRISNQFKMAVSNYTKESANINFIATFNKILNEVNIVNKVSN